MLLPDCPACSTRRRNSRSSGTGATASVGPQQPQWTGSVARGLCKLRVRQAPTSKHLFSCLSKKHISIPNKAADSTASAHFTQFLLSVQAQLYLDGAGIRPPPASQCKQVAQLGHSCLPWRRRLEGHHPPCCLPSLSQPPDSQKIPAPPHQVPGSQLAPSGPPSKAPRSQACLVQGTEWLLHGQEEEAPMQVQREVYFWAHCKMPTRHTSPSLSTAHSHRKVWHSFLRLLGS